MTRRSRYSLGSPAWHGLTGRRRRRRAIPDAEPQSGYDVVIVGAGGHGLATAYHLARDHGITDVAVIDKGYIGGPRPLPAETSRSSSTPDPIGATSMFRAVSPYRGGSGSPTPRSGCDRDESYRRLSLA